MRRLRHVGFALLLLLTLISSSGAQPAAQFVGNVHSKVFHRLTCRYATCKNCTKAFSTRDAAIAAGYRPGKCCNP